MDDIDLYAGQPDLMAQQEALARRKARIEAEVRLAAQQAGVFKPYTPDNTEIGGFTLSTQTPGVAPTRIPGRVVPPSWGAAMQALTPLVAQYGAGQRENQYAQDQAAFNARARADRAARLAAMPQGTPYSATPTNPPSETNPNGNFVEANVTPAAEPSLRERLEWAASLHDSPLLQGVGDALTTDILVKEPERKENREFRASEAELNRQERAARAEADRKSRELIASQGNELRAFIAQTVASGKAPPVTHLTATGTTDDEGRPQFFRNGNPADIVSGPGKAAKEKVQHLTPAGVDEEGRPMFIVNGDPDNVITGKGVKTQPKSLTPTQTANQVKRAELIDKLSSSASILSTIEPGRWKSFAAANETLPVGRLIGGEWGDVYNAWAAFRTVKNEIRHGNFGSALTPTEKAAFDSTTIDTFTDPVLARKHISGLVAMAQRAAIRQDALDQGGKMDPRTGAVTLRGRVVEGTINPNAPAASTPTTPTTPRSDSNALPTTEQGYRDLWLKAQAAHLNPKTGGTAATKRAMEEAHTDLLRFQANGGVNKGSPGTNPGDTVKWGDLK